MNVRTESVACNQCGSREADVVGRGSDREYYCSSDVFDIVCCRNCSLVYLNPRPTSDELPRIYPPSYHSYILDDAVDSKGSFITRMRQKAGARRFAPIMRHVRSLPKIDLLDVGCGNGWLLQVIKSLDPDRIETFGVEISEPVCQTARKLGHSVYCGRFEDVNLDRRFDVINLTHVIEHVSDPRLVVRKAYEATKPGGLLVLETPNIGSIEWPWFKESNWGAYHVPRHWFFFNRDTIQSLAAAEGFTMVDWYCHPGPTHWVWTAHNICMARTGLLAEWGRKIFDPIKIFRDGLGPTAILGAFWFLDMGILCLKMQTSVMTGIFKKV
jgi:2-polyprenyl-3-methyl-5-hydroxy-6-metoxy-1,4-benzoquinol methylase